MFDATVRLYQSSRREDSRESTHKESNDQANQLPSELVAGDSKSPRHQWLLQQLNPAAIREHHDAPPVAFATAGINPANARRL
jgi:hypothetical protein